MDAVLAVEGVTDRVKRNTAKALTIATTLAVAGSVAAAGTLDASSVASPSVEPISYTVNTPFDNAAAVAVYDSRSAFAERASRAAADRHARLVAIKNAKASKAKAARAAKKAAARKAAARKAAAAKRKAVLTTRPVTAGSARALGKKMAAQRGWTGSQWAALDRLWMAESSWRVTAGNGSTGAYGIPQAMPGSKMASAGSNWQTSAATQIEWGLDYIDSRWGSPMGAYSHFLSNHWY